MKPKYTERLKQGVSIGAAALALSGCDDSKKVLEAVDIRWELNACLNKAHPGSIAVNKNIRHWHSPDFSHYGGYIDCGERRLLTFDIDNNTCSIHTLKHTSETGVLVCTDDDGNGTWESVGSARISVGDLLVPADKASNPKKWKSYQDVCNKTYYDCLNY